MLLIILVLKFPANGCSVETDRFVVALGFVENLAGCQAFEKFLPK